MTHFPLTRQDALDLTYTVEPAIMTVRGNTISAIVTAALANQNNNTTNPITTASIAKGSASGPDIENLYTELGQNGFTVTNGTTTFTVSF